VVDQELVVFAQQVQAADPVRTGFGKPDFTFQARPPGRG
jgi:hypothetical protein